MCVLRSLPIYAVYAISSLDTELSLRHRTQKTLHEASSGHNRELPGSPRAHSPAIWDVTLRMAMANEFARDVYILRLKNDPLERESLFSRITTAMHTHLLTYHLLRADPLEHSEESDRQFLSALTVLANVQRLKRVGRTNRYITCLLYTSPSPRDGLLSRMPSSA